jgi:2-dehydropantoate 2-reductase
MKICILGAGALGCAIGGVLTEGGSEVHLVNRTRSHVDAMNERGLTLTDGGAERVVKVQAWTDCQDIGPVDLIVVLVKSFHTRAAIEGALPLIGANTVVLSLQNGLGHEDVLAEVVGRERVLAGKTYAGGVMLAPGHVIAGTRGKQSYIGELDGQVTQRARAIAEEFNRAGLQTTVTDNIIGAMWDKLLVNVATGALSGITRLTYGDLYAVPELRACALAAVGEAIAVAAASGVTVSITEPVQAWDMAAAGLPAEFKTSMLQSLEKGSVTEIDFINGAVVRWGEKCKVPTPINQALVACIKGIERAMLTPR